MPDDPVVYHKLKQDLLEDLKAMMDAQRSASGVLEKKASDLLSIASATFGIAISIESALKSSSAGPGFWGGVGVVTLLYIVLVFQVRQAVKPLQWRLVPGVRDKPLTIDALYEKYIDPN